MLNVVSAEDLVKVLVSHGKMKALRSEAAKAYVQRETGAVAGITRAVQAATAPTLLQRGSREPVASGGSREASSVAVDAEGRAVAERRVERAVVLPDGTGVRIQQCAQQVLLPAKRKARAGVEGADARVLELQCERMQLDNEQRRVNGKLATVRGFASAMQALDPAWRRDRRRVLQAQDYLQHSLFRASAASASTPVPQVASASASTPVSQVASASTPVPQVASELGAVSQEASDLADARAAGKRAARMCRALHGAPSPKNDQTV